MSFGWLNLTGAGILALMLVPNAVYAARKPGQQNACKSRLLNALEQAGRYGCMLLMVVPLGVGEFGFASAEGLVLWCTLGAALLLAYLLCWVRHFRRPSFANAVLLAALPCVLFFARGMFLRHYLLCAFAVLLALTHIPVTVCNAGTRRD